MEHIDERNLLRVVREVVTNHESALPLFKEVISPLYDAFFVSGIDKDIYRGWAFDLEFINASLSDCKPYEDEISSTDSTWKVFSESQDDCTCVVPGKGLIKIHLYSFLWNF